MRVIRSSLLLLAVALCAAGCASQPVAYVQMPPPGQMQPSIDTVTYGAPAAGPGYAYHPGYAAPAATAYAYPASTTCTGLLTCVFPQAFNAYPTGPGYAYQGGATAYQAVPRYAYPAAAAPAAGPAPLYNSTATAPRRRRRPQSPRSRPTRSSRATACASWCSARTA
jgi:hypothetical protein